MIAASWSRSSTTEKSSSGRKLDGKTMRPWLLRVKGCTAASDLVESLRMGSAGRPHGRVGELADGRHAGVHDPADERPGVLVGDRVLRHDGVDDAVLEQVERPDALTLGQQGRVL